MIDVQELFCRSCRKGGDMFLNRLAVGCGGFIGSVLRYLIGAATSPSSFPLSTLAINVAGSFALAAFAALVLRGAIADGELSLLLRVGLCGGFTTMSMFSLEMVDMVSRGAWAGAVGYACPHMHAMRRSCVRRRDRRIQNGLACPKNGTHRTCRCDRILASRYRGAGSRIGGCDCRGASITGAPCCVSWDKRVRSVCPSWQPLGAFS